MIDVAEAYRLVMARALPAPPVRLPLLQALGRVLAAPIDAPIAWPIFDHAAMDGYALRASDLLSATAERPVSLPLRGEAQAGAVPGALMPGSACRIMTGALLPDGADAVIKQEDVRLAAGGDGVEFSRPAEPDEHIRLAGEDLRAGERLLEAGRVVDVGAVALLAGLGLAEVAVHRAPRVAILTSGDELVEPGERLLPGQIYNSNAFALMAMVHEAGGLPTRLPVVADDREAVARALGKALTYDVIVTTGGVSVGDYDFLTEAIADLATLHVHGVAQQPGKPFLFASAGTCAIFGLPGNPAAALVCAEVYLRPFLRRVLGDASPERGWVTAVAAQPFHKKPGRQAFVRARVVEEPGGYLAFLAGPQSSGSLRSLAAANALVVAPAEGDGFMPGDPVEAMLLSPPPPLTPAHVALVRSTVSR